MRKKCNKCGTIIEEVYVPNFKIEDENNKLSYDLTIYPGKDYDMCRDCYSELQNYVKTFCNDKRIIENVNEMVSHDNRVTKIKFSISMNLKKEDDIS